MGSDEWLSYASGQLWQYMVDNIPPAGTAGARKACECLGGDGMELIVDMLRPDPL